MEKDNEKEYAKEYVLKAIKSCTNIEQYRTAERLVGNYEFRFREREPELGDVLLEKYLALNKNN